jgi:hypothetical protein
MNKVIEELAIKSNLVYKTWPNSKTLFIDGHYTTISGKPALMSNCPDYDNSGRIQRFVELIVKECAEQIIAKGTDWVDFAPSQSGVRPEYWDMAQHIKQHFGMET